MDERDETTAAGAVVRVELYDPGSQPPVLMWASEMRALRPGDSLSLKLPAYGFTPRVVLRYPGGRVEDTGAPACAPDCARLLRARARVEGAGVGARVSATPPPPGVLVSWVMCRHGHLFTVTPQGGRETGQDGQ